MNDVMIHRDSCRLCGGRDYHLILRLAPTPIADAYVPALEGPRKQESHQLDLYLCATCGHAQLLDVIDPAVLYRDYIYVTTSSMGLSDHFKGYARHVVEKLKSAPRTLVVDIGSNDGTLLGHFQVLGLRGLGVEPAHEIARAATQSGVETQPEFFTPRLAASLRASHGPAGLITMNNLFANIDDLQGTVAGVRDLLAPDGVFVFETFYFLDYLQNLVFDFMYHEHLSYFTVRPLQRFFASLGLELFDLERVSTKGGSLRCFVQHMGGPRVATPVVAERAAEEEALDLQNPHSELFQTFRARIETQRSRVMAELARLRAEGKRIAGYGASATTTTLIYHFGITDQIDYLIDDNPAKQNTLSPGCHLPVHDSTAVTALKPDVILILAWRYSDAIMAQQQAFRERGGRFLIPLPECRLI